LLFCFAGESKDWDRFAALRKRNATFVVFSLVG
jgi:hypothetical protein